MPPSTEQTARRVLRRFLAKLGPVDLTYWHLDKLIEGKPTTLYHGTTRSFQSFDMSKSRTELVDRFYGSGIFLTPSKSVAWRYANANRNIGFDPSIIDDLKKINRNAGAFLESLYKDGGDGWENYWKDHGFFNEDGSVKIDEFEDHVGVDSNRLGDIAQYIIGSKYTDEPDENEFINIFQQSTGAPDHIYDTLDKVGLDSTVYRPKVYTVVVTVRNTLLTAKKSQAKGAKSKGYDSVVFHGSGLVDNVPEVAVFNPSAVKIVKIETD